MPYAYKVTLVRERQIGEHPSLVKTEAVEAVVLTRSWSLFEPEHASSWRIGAAERIRLPEDGRIASLVPLGKYDELYIKDEQTPSS